MRETYTIDASFTTRRLDAELVCLGAQRLEKFLKLHRVVVLGCVFVTVQVREVEFVRAEKPCDQLPKALEHFVAGRARASAPRSSPRSCIARSAGSRRSACRAERWANAASVCEMMRFTSSTPRSGPLTLLWLATAALCAVLVVRGIGFPRSGSGTALLRSMGFGSLHGLPAGFPFASSRWILPPPRSTSVPFSNLSIGLPRYGPSVATSRPLGRQAKVLRERAVACCVPQSFRRPRTRATRLRACTRRPAHRAPTDRLRGRRSSA